MRVYFPRIFSDEGVPGMHFHVVPLRTMPRIKSTVPRLKRCTFFAFTATTTWTSPKMRRARSIMFKCPKVGDQDPGNTALTMGITVLPC